MRCPFCGSEDTQVKDSRPAEDNTSIRRRRICPDCGGRKLPFDREKLVRSFEIALRKRPVDRDRIERAVSGIVRRLESSGETEIPSEEIGLQVLEALKSLDDVAFVRYASVYRDFSHAEDFENVIAEINAKIARDTDAGV